MLTAIRLDSAVLVKHIAGALVVVRRKITTIKTVPNVKNNRRATLAVAIGVLCVSHNHASAGAYSDEPGAGSQGEPAFSAPLNFISSSLFNADPCANVARNWGRIIGGVGGYFLGKKLGDDGLGSKLAGVAIGTFLGDLIGRDIDHRRCELSRIAKEHNLDVEFQSDAFDMPQDGLNQATQSAAQPLSPAKVPELSPGDDAPRKSEALISRWGGLGHFEPNSDQLTPEAREYFSAVADQYVPDKQLAAFAQEASKKAAASGGKGGRDVSAELGAKNREELRKHFEQIQMVIMGHSDDTGRSAYNAKLSEKRAKSVAELFQARGVSSDRIVYRGAGETDPVADNRTEEGRAKNRRVEVIELQSRDLLVQYLKAKKPNFDYYRPRIDSDHGVESDSVNELAPGVGGAKVGETATVKQAKPVAPSGAKSASTASREGKTAVTASPAPSGIAEIDFGGVPADKDSNRDLAAILGERVKQESSFMAKLKSTLISEAHADFSGDKIYQVSCLRDSPRISGDYLSLNSGKPLDYRTAEYLPGMYATTWLGEVNGHTVALTPVAVLRDSARPSANPVLYVYANTSSPGRAAKPSIKAQTVVNVYAGTGGVLYRVFSAGKGPVQCSDLVFPYAAPFEAKGGKLFYSKTGQPFVANFKPHMLGQ